MRYDVVCSLLLRGLFMFAAGDVMDDMPYALDLEVARIAFLQAYFANAGLMLPAALAALSRATGSDTRASKGGYAPSASRDGLCEGSSRLDPTSISDLRQRPSKSTWQRCRSRCGTSPLHAGKRRFATACNVNSRYSSFSARAWCTVRIEA